MTMIRGAIAKKVVATRVVAIDGTGDYTDIQTAVDSLPSDGGVVYVKEGTYTITSTITLSNPQVSIVGTGHGTLIKCTTLGIDVISITAPTCRIEDLAIQGRSVLEATGSGISISNTSYSCIVRNVLIGLCHYGILLTDTTLDCFIYFNQFSGNDYGIYLDECDDSIFIGNIITGNVIDSIYVNDSDNNIFVGNYTWLTITGYGLNITSSAVQNIVTGNTLDSFNDLGTNTQIGENIPYAPKHRFPDNDGTSKYIIENSDGNPIFQVDSKGRCYAKKYLNL